ncbi:ribonuclease H-like domain-containing protein [Tanacetum coccineum]|uniref:Ribonuclease H-like domain-containing protein n=1 Tax=Tanacetum coccineum TaxID=301880 RepID=A0ABQ5IGV0_9ASTR
MLFKTRFGGNEATKKTQKALLKQQYENFNALSSKSLDSIFNRLLKLVSRLEILGVFITTEDLNSKFLRSLPPKWNTHVVVWINKADIETMSIDDLYNNFKIIELEVKKYVGASTGDQNMAFMSTPSTSSTIDVNIANPACKVSTVNSNVNTASSSVSTANISDNVLYAFMVENPNGSNLLQQDLEQIHEDGLEAMDLKWQLSLMSMRAKRYFQRIRKKIFINDNDTAKFDKSKVECFNCHKMGHFARELEHQGTKMAMLAIDGVGFDWSDMAEEQVQINMALIVFSNFELNETEFKASTYKRGLATVEEQLVTFRRNEVLFSEEIAVLKREVGCKDYEIGLDEFKEPEFNGYGRRDTILKSTIHCDNESDNSKETTDDSLEKEQVSKDENSSVESPLNVVKETVFHTAKKVEFVKPKNNEKPVRKSFRPRAVNTARPYTTQVNIVREKGVNAIKPSASWVWRPTRPNGASLVFNRYNYIDARGRSNGCSRHMTGNIAYLLDFKEFDGGYVTFGGGAYGGRITGKGTLKTDNLDFNDVYFVNELKFNLFSVSQMCDKKNYVLFTDTECLVLSPNFKLPDESQILLKIP